MACSEIVGQTLPEPKAGHHAPPSSAILTPNISRVQGMVSQATTAAAATTATTTPLKSRTCLEQLRDTCACLSRKAEDGTHFRPFPRCQLLSSSPGFASAQGYRTKLAWFSPALEVLTGSCSGRDAGARHDGNKTPVSLCRESGGSGLESASPFLISDSKCHTPCARDLQGQSGTSSSASAATKHSQAKGKRYRSTRDPLNFVTSVVMATARARSRLLHLSLSQAPRCKVCQLGLVFIRGARNILVQGKGIG